MYHILFIHSSADEHLMLLSFLSQRCDPHHALFPDFANSLPITPFRPVPSKFHMFNPDLGVCFQRTQTNTSAAMRDPTTSG